MTGFIVYALPRSRTYWLSQFLNYAPWRCHHDLALDVDNVRDFVARFKSGHVGTVETGTVLGWKILRKMMPRARVAVVRRPLSEVRESLAAFGIKLERGDLERKDALLDEVADCPETLSVSFADLQNEACCARLFEHCLQRPFDSGWWLGLSSRNLQIDMHARLKKMALRKAALDLLKAEVSALQAAM